MSGFKSNVSAGFCAAKSTAKTHVLPRWRVALITALYISNPVLAACLYIAWCDGQMVCRARLIAQAKADGLPAEFIKFLEETPTA